MTALKRARTSATRQGYSAPALEKGMDIIEALAQAEGGLTVSEIAARLGRSMSELFRIVVVMERRGWLRKDPGTGQYSVSYHLLRLAHQGTPAQTLTAAAAPVMHQLSTDINQSCHLVVRAGDHGLVVLRKENQRRHANLSVRLGAVIDLPGSCSGLTLLAHLDAEERHRVLESIGSVRGAALRSLLNLLDRIRKRGYEVHRSPITPGVTDISCPVRGHDGKVIAALTVPYLHALDGSAPYSVAGTREKLQQAAHRISQSLGLER